MLQMLPPFYIKMHDVSDQLGNASSHETGQKTREERSVCVYYGATVSAHVTDATPTSIVRPQVT